MQRARPLRVLLAACAFAASALFLLAAQGHRVPVAQAAPRSGDLPTVTAYVSGAESGDTVTIAVHGEGFTPGERLRVHLCPWIADIPYGAKPSACAPNISTGLGETSADTTGTFKLAVQAPSPNRQQDQAAIVEVLRSDATIVGETGAVWVYLEGNRRATSWDVAGTTLAYVGCPALFFGLFAWAFVQGVRRSRPHAGAVAPRS